MSRKGLLGRMGTFPLLILTFSPLARAAEEAAEHKPGIINLDVSLILQIVNFIILIWILNRYLFQPLSAFLAKRSEGIKQSLDEAKGAREEAARMQQEYQARMVAIQREAEARREEALRQVEEERRRLLVASRDEAEHLVGQARAQIEREVERAKATLQEEAVTLSLQVAERVLRRNLTGEDHRRLAEQFIEEVGRGA